MHRVTSDSKRGRQMIAATRGTPGNAPYAKHTRSGKPFMGAKQIAKAATRASAVRPLHELVDMKTKL